MKERTVSTEQIFQGRIVNLRVDDVILPDGRRSRREIVEARGAVAIVALDGDGNLLLVRQFRKPVEREIWEIPAGTLEAGESPLDCARRELAEETGCQAAVLQPLVSFYTSPGFCDEEMHLFMAQQLSAIPQRLEEDETLEVSKVPLARALEMVGTGEIVDAKTLVGLLWLARGQR